MAYVYMHIRHDKDEPFYIGIGKSDSNFYRAHCKRRRNNIWKKIIAKTSYSIKILHEKITWEEACDVEKKLIATYKKKTEGGTLCNISDGGEGGDLGYDVNKKHSETIKGHNNPSAVPVYQYAKDGSFIKKWDYIKQPADFYNINQCNISACFSGRQKTSAGFRWSKIKLHEENIISNTDTTSIMRH